MRKLNRRYYIYKYMAANEIIYIGKTYRPLSERIYEHSLESKFQAYSAVSYVCWFEVSSRVEMDVAEKILIAKYKPVLNVVDNDESVLVFTDFTEPEWKSYACWNGYGVNSGKHAWKQKELQKNMLQLQLHDLEIQESLLQHLDDWLEYMWELYLNIGWDYVDDKQFRYTWDFDSYPVISPVLLDNGTYALYTEKCYDAYRHNYTCAADISDVRYLMDHGRDWIQEQSKQFLLKRLDLMERMDKLY